MDLDIGYKDESSRIQVNIYLPCKRSRLETNRHSEDQPLQKSNFDIAHFGIHTKWDKLMEAYLIPTLYQLSIVK